jgi:hypothetical protein
MNLRHIFVKIWGDEEARERDTSQPEETDAHATQPKPDERKPAENQAPTKPKQKKQKTSITDVNIVTEPDIESDSSTHARKNSSIWWQPRTLPHAPKDKAFFFEDGDSVSNLAELHNRLQRMSKATYKKYAAGTRNDFACWIEHVLEDLRTANAMRNAASLDNAIEIINMCLERYDA